ncbi:hypothetical protein BC940DRAFT_329199 [Gongronella butleri]|nr:hypothetical protein BC940DRAFT_329199 [Gongronella butleri]
MAGINYVWGFWLYNDFKEFALDHQAVIEDLWHMSSQKTHRSFVMYPMDPRLPNKAAITFQRGSQEHAQHHKGTNELGTFFVNCNQGAGRSLQSFQRVNRSVAAGSLLESQASVNYAQWRAKQWTKQCKNDSEVASGNPATQELLECRHEWSLVAPGAIIEELIQDPLLPAGGARLVFFNHCRLLRDAGNGYMMVRRRQLCHGAPIHFAWWLTDAENGYVASQFDRQGSSSSSVAAVQEKSAGSGACVDPNRTVCFPPSSQAAPLLIAPIDTMSATRFVPVIPKIPHFPPKISHPAPETSASLPALAKSTLMQPPRRPAQVFPLSSWRPSSIRDELGPWSFARRDDKPVMALSPPFPPMMTSFSSIPAETGQMLLFAPMPMSLPETSLDAQ